MIFYFFLIFLGNMPNSWMKMKPLRPISSNSLQSDYSCLPFVCEKTPLFFPNS